MKNLTCEEAGKIDEVMKILADYFRPMLNYDVNIPFPLIRQAALRIADKLGVPATLLENFRGGKPMKKWKKVYLEVENGLSYGVQIYKIEDIQHSLGIIEHVLYPSGKIIMPSRQKYGNIFKFKQPFMNVVYKFSPQPRNCSLDVLELEESYCFLYSAMLIGKNNYSASRLEALQNFHRLQQQKSGKAVEDFKSDGENKKINAKKDRQNDERRSQRKDKEPPASISSIRHSTTVDLSTKVKKRGPGRPRKHPIKNPCTPSPESEANDHSPRVKYQISGSQNQNPILPAMNGGLSMTPVEVFEDLNKGRGTAESRLIKKPCNTSSETNVQSFSSHINVVGLGFKIPNPTFARMIDKLSPPTVLTPSTQRKRRGFNRVNTKGKQMRLIRQVNTRASKLELDIPHISSREADEDLKDFLLNDVDQNYLMDETSELCEQISNESDLLTMNEMPAPRDETEAFCFPGTKFYRSETEITTIFDEEEFIIRCQETESVNLIEPGEESLSGILENLSVDTYSENLIKLPNQELLDTFLDKYLSWAENSITLSDPSTKDLMTLLEEIDVTKEINSDEQEEIETLATSLELEALAKEIIPVEEMGIESLLTTVLMDSLGEDINSAEQENQDSLSMLLEPLGTTITPIEPPQV